MIRGGGIRWLLGHKRRNTGSYAVNRPRPEHAESSFLVNLLQRLLNEGSFVANNTNFALLSCFRLTCGVENGSDTGCGIGMSQTPDIAEKL
jgi:hypothetical protein